MPLQSILLSQIDVLPDKLIKVFKRRGGQIGRRLQNILEPTAQVRKKLICVYTLGKIIILTKCCLSLYARSMLKITWDFHNLPWVRFLFLFFLLPALELCVEFIVEHLSMLWQYSASLHGDFTSCITFLSILRTQITCCNESIFVHLMC